MRYRLSTISLLAGFVAPASGAVTMSVLTAGGSGASVTVAPGGVFSVDIRLDIQDVVVVAAQAQLVAGAPNVLDITGGSYNAADWDASWGLPIDPMGLDPVGSGTIGSLPAGDHIGPTAVTVLATIHLSVDPAAAAGTYTLNLINASVGDDTFTDIDAIVGPDFIVTVSGSAPPGGGGTTPPDDGGIAPPDDGGTEPPDDQGTEPPNDDGTDPPDDGDTSSTGDGGTTPNGGNATIPTVTRCGAGMIETLSLSLTALLARPRRRFR